MNEQILYNRPTFPAQLDYSHPLTKGLVGCWVLNDVGMRAWDSSYSQNHGLATGTKASYFSRLFNGTSDKVLGSKNVGSYLPNLRIFTIMSWIKPTAINAGKPVLVERELSGTAQSTFQFWHSVTNNGSIYIESDNSGLASQSYLSANTISQIGVTRNISDVTFLYNGVAVESGTLATTATLRAGARLQIGANYTTSPDTFYGGTIYMVTVHNRVLPKSEYQWLHREPYSMFLR